MRRVMLALIVVFPALVTIAAATGSPVVEALPPGFSDVLVTSVSRPTAVEHLANDRTVVLEQHTGRVRLINTNSGTLLPGFALDLAVCTANEQGLLGFTDDPEFASNGRVYVYYTTPIGGGCRNRVSAFTMIGDTIAPGSEQVLIETPTVRTNHNGGDLEVGNDGLLYVSIGDGGADPRGDSGSAGASNAAQDRSILHGKILRLDRATGQPAVDNPFNSDANATNCGSGGTTVPPSAVCREIYAFGLRNPYRFAFDPNTNATRFFINDVGQGTQEEVDEAVAGANYGWNSREGNCPQGQNPPCAGPSFGQLDPITSYPRSQGTYITGGAFVPDGAWPSQYDGGYLFADGGSGKVWLRDASGNVDYGNPFLTDRYGIADMAFVLEPTGWALYYTQSFSGGGQVRKITYTTSPSTPSGPLAFERLPEIRRVFDSRNDPPPARVRGGRTRLIELGAEAVGAEAALVNITLSDPSGIQFATVWEPRTTRPATSNVNALVGEVVANSSIVPVDEQGRMLFYTRATTDLIVDVMGVFRDAPAPAAGGRFESADVARLADSRQPSGAGNEYTRVSRGIGELVSVAVVGRAGIPSSGVDSVALLVSGLSGPGPASGWLAAYQGGAVLPLASNVNVNGSGDVRVNLAVVPVAPDGSIDVFMYEMADVIVEVVGWFTDGTAPSTTAGRFRLLNPTREVDSRNGIGFSPLADGESEVLNPASVPDTAGAVAQNLTFAPTAGWGYVTASDSLPAPLISNLNGTAPGQVRAALAITPLGPGGSEVFTGASPISFDEHQLVVDVFGYFE